ncbi:MAG: Protein cbp3, mitochondrial [Candelina submexicana]|nr:MAG: Protein cbp3, mitochondrial [Candelina submexicana]
MTIELVLLWANNFQHSTSFARRTFSVVTRRYSPESEAKKFHSPAPIVPPKSDPPSKDADSRPPDHFPDASTAAKIARAVRKSAPGITETYIVYGVADDLLKECARQAEYSVPQAKEKGAETPKSKDGEDLGVGKGWWFETLGLTPTFNTWAQITFLHMYLLTVRFRCFPPEYAPAWHQHLLDHFFYKAEDRMTVEHQVHSRAIRNKYLKDLFIQWRGLTAGYDEGIARGDAVLATAVWRNIFKGDDEVNFKHLGMVVSYLRAVLKGLDSLSDEAIAEGQIQFGNPGVEEALVMKKSKLLDTPFKDKDPKLPGGERDTQ